MSSFNSHAYTIVWNSLGERTKERVRAKARWEHITCSAALRWLYPKKWAKIMKTSEPVMKVCIGLRGSHQ